MKRSVLILSLCLVGLFALASGAYAFAPGPPGPPPAPVCRPWCHHICPTCGGTGWEFEHHHWERCDRCKGSGCDWHRAGGGDHGGDHHDGHGWNEHDWHSGNCFVATAAFGTPWEPNVATLRSFRDRFLLTNSVGQGFVAAYYHLSPPLAHAIASSPWARAATRATLTPFVVVAGAFLGNPADLAILAVAIPSGLLLGRSVRRSLKKRRTARLAA
jgi:hypothetical protein